MTRAGVECTQDMADYYDKRFEEEPTHVCRKCGCEISENEYGLCDECYEALSDCVYDDMCKGCIDEKYCHDNCTICEEFDKEFERRIKNEL